MGPTAPLPRLYGVTDEALLPSPILVARVRLACEAGLRLVQVRFKRTEPEERRRLGRELRAVTRDLGALLVVNDLPDLAAEIGADGVHLGAEDVPVERARALLGTGAIVGMSAYGDEALVRESAARGASYVGLSSPYPSPTKGGKPTPDREAFRWLAALCPVPAFAIGGLDVARAREVRALGCHGAAVVSGLFGAPDLAGRVRDLLLATS